MRYNIHEQSHIPIIPLLCIPLSSIASSASVCPFRPSPLSSIHSISSHYLLSAFLNFFSSPFLPSCNFFLFSSSFPLFPFPYPLYSLSPICAIRALSSLYALSPLAPTLSILSFLPLSFLRPFRGIPREAHQERGNRRKVCPIWPVAGFYDGRSLASRMGLGFPYSTD